ncbi:MAG: right-handed parallel beta-helix repeat-containing protein [Methanobrevibacter sp.]|uniref:right-handed parallel beta-helix repeat-containing protein n=1 Tax=Methanobrevibacter sp. TaxID=66852 RepID=UPI0025F5D6AD|nr:right-handed parallel beta-helix repeat-containing protein [Methanobrevibacter sp.]MBR0272332.1 right-handed parallel beta-helix repeat-containing protein [Methanobrevibacter sp.]
MKLNNKILALLLVFVAILSVSAVSAEDIAADDVVAIDASSDAEVLSTSYDVPADATVSDIEAIIANTSAGDTLNFAENATYDFGNLSSGVKIEHTLILQGNGATVKGYQGFSFEADEESVAGTQVYNFNFEMTNPILWNGRALEFFGGSDYIIEDCTFKNGNSGIYIRRPTGNVTIQNNYFFGDEGATNQSTITGDFAKQETGSKAINLMGGSGITIINNTFEGDLLDAVSIASGAANVEMYNNTMNNVWYGVFYGGGITNITMQGNKIKDSKAFAIGIIKAAGNSDIYENEFTTPAGKSAIYVEEGNTAHGAPSNIETILIHDNIFYGEDSTAISASSKGGMITPKGAFEVVDNAYETGITVFAFTDNNTYTFKTSNLVVEENNVTIENNVPFTNANITVTEDEVSIELAEDATGFLLVEVDGIATYAPVEDGQATVELPYLEPGNYTVNVIYTGDMKYGAASASEEITIEGPDITIFADDLVKIDKAADKFVADFTDDEGNPLANTNITFNINGNDYTRATDANGQASIAINLGPGEYTVITTNPVTGDSIENTITVLSRFFDNADLVKYYRNDSQFVIGLFDDEGNPLANTNVTFNINGVLYNRTTDATGHAKMNINLNPNNYVITAEYKGAKVAQNITVLPVLTAQDLTKKFGEAGAFKATLVDGQGKAYANQTVTFNINGVLYERNTNDEGVASLNINLQPGEYIITSSYKIGDGFATIANNVTVTA